MTKPRSLGQRAECVQTSRMETKGEETPSSGACAPLRGASRDRSIVRRRLYGDKNESPKPRHYHTSTDKLVHVRWAVVAFWVAASHGKGTPAGAVLSSYILYLC